jgi:hypothetical protein
MKKPLKKRGKAENAFLQLKINHEWDTVKVQVMEKLRVILNPMDPAALNFTDFIIKFQVPRFSVKPLPLDSSAAYTFMISRAIKSSDPTVNLTVEPVIQHKCVSWPTILLFMH